MIRADPPNPCESRITGRARASSKSAFAAAERPVGKRGRRFVSDEMALADGRGRGGGGRRQGKQHRRKRGYGRVSHSRLLVSAAVALAKGSGAVMAVTKLAQPSPSQ